MSTSISFVKVSWSAKVLGVSHSGSKLYRASNSTGYTTVPWSTSSDYHVLVYGAGASTDGAVWAWPASSTTKWSDMIGKTVMVSSPNGASYSVANPGGSISSASGVQYSHTIRSADTSKGTASGSSSVIFVDNSYYSGSDVTVTARPKDGHVFTGWSGDTSDSGVTISNNTCTISKNAAADITVTANFVRVCTVMFVNGYDGTVLKTESVQSGGSATPPSDPSRTGYAFAGWSGTYANVTSDQTVTATWTANTYTVTLDRQGGSSGTTSVTATYGSSMPEMTRPQRVGYTFGGYYTTKVPSQGVQYYTSSGASARAWNLAQDKTLYAYWTANTYTVNLDQQSGSGGTTSVTATYGQALPAPINLPTRANYTFGGYYTGVNGSGTQFYAANGYTWSTRLWTTAANSTLYARWTAKSYAVTFDKQGGSGGTNSVSATYNETMTAVTPPTRVGYTFGGYYSAKNGGGKQYYTASGTSSVASDITYNITLYAKWTAKSYKLVIDADGGTYRGESSYTYPDDDPGGNKLTTGSPDLSLLFVPVRSGHVFNGFYTTRGAGGEMVYDADGRAVAGTYWTAPYVTYQNRGNFKGIANASATSLNVYARWTELMYVRVRNGVYGDAAEIDSSVASVSYSPDSSYTKDAHKAFVNYTDVTVTVSPATGWIITGYDIRDKNGNSRGGGTGSSGPVQISLASISYDAEVYVQFARAKYAVVFDVDTPSKRGHDDDDTQWAGTIAATKPASGGGTAGVTSGDEVEHGTEVTFAATPATGYTFGGWFNGSTRVSTDMSYTVGITSAISLVARFSCTATFQLSCAEGTSAQVKVNGYKRIPTDDAEPLYEWTRPTYLGERVLCQVVPSEGYFDSWYSVVGSAETRISDMQAEAYHVFADHETIRAKVVSSVTRSLTVYAVLKDGSTYEGLTFPEGHDDFVSVDQIDADEVQSGASLLSTTPAYETGSSKPFSRNETCWVRATATTPMSYVSGGVNLTAYFLGWARSFGGANPIVSGEISYDMLLNDSGMKLYAVYQSDARNVDVTVAYATGSGTSMGRIAIVGGTQTSSPYTRNAMQGATLTLVAAAMAGYRFVGWYRRADAAGDAFSKLANLVITVEAESTYYACFVQDNDKIFEWEGGTENKVMEWRSKTYALAKPENPSAVRVDSLGYKDGSVLEVKVEMFSSPYDAPESPVASSSLANVRSQTVRRLPQRRPERYMQVAVENNEEVDALFVGTSTGGLAV